jgi:hypothetical protein
MQVCKNRLFIGVKRMRVPCESTLARVKWAYVEELRRTRLDLAEAGI